MSQIIAVAGTSHSPVLAMEPAVMWNQRAETDRNNPELYDNAGAIRPYDDLKPVIERIGFLTGDDRAAIFEGNARIVFPRLKF